ncbi:hypothetical protein FD15_GL002265 [Liquorilactobacillus sucicola DSM 21376 = JCM 15457]|uniref:Uncharacterized protein n=2 Tax=Liquorilactobacillus sucicola TaxID=519050 RepID=A0A0R2DQJ3_9LACO|nr:hypothetical protein FD15_GL002265 [Liquorilactobacillus sucicola DSM 21376 = JCM 15457]
MKFYVNGAEEMEQISSYKGKIRRLYVQLIPQLVINCKYKKYIEAETSFPGTDSDYGGYTNKMEARNKAAWNGKELDAVEKLYAACQMRIPAATLTLVRMVKKIEQDNIGILNNLKKEVLAGSEDAMNNLQFFGELCLEQSDLEKALEVCLFEVEMNIEGSDSRLAQVYKKILAQSICVMHCYRKSFQEGDK